MPRTIIGGTDPSERNISSANGDNGITIGSDNNIIQGNYIGTDITGTLDRGNIDDGIDIISNGSNNMIGGTDPGAGNLVAYTNDDGIDIDNGTGNSMLGNQVFGSGDNDFEINPVANNGQSACRRQPTAITASSFSARTAPSSATPMSLPTARAMPTSSPAWASI